MAAVEPSPSTGASSLRVIPTIQPVTDDQVVARWRWFMLGLVCASLALWQVGAFPTLADWPQCVQPPVYWWQVLGWTL